MNQTKTRSLLVVFAAVVGLVASGCAGFWASTAPSAKKGDTAEESDKSKKASAEDDGDAKTKAETDAESNAGKTEATAKDTADGTKSTEAEKAKTDKTDPVKMKVSASGSEPAKVTLVWVVEAPSSDVGEDQLVLRVKGGKKVSGLTACRKVAIDADIHTFEGERVGMEGPPGGRKLTAYLSSDSLSTLSEADAVTVSACDYRFPLNADQKSKLGNLASSNGSSSDGADTADAAPDSAADDSGMDSDTETTGADEDAPGSGGTTPTGSDSGSGY